MDYKGKYREFITFIVVSFSYFLCLRLGLLFSTKTQISLFWPATGIGISMLGIFGRRLWPAIALGALLSNLITAAPLITTVGITLANTLEAAIGAWIFQVIKTRYKNRNYPLITLATVLGVLIASIASSSLGVFSLAIDNIIPWNLYHENWYTWFVADFMGGIIFAPFLLSLFGKSNQFKSTPIFTMIVVLLLSFGISYFAFFTANGAPYLYFIFPLFIFCFTAFDERVSKVLIISFSLGMMFLTKMGISASFFVNSSYFLMHIEILLLALSLSSLLISDLFLNSKKRAFRNILLIGGCVSGLIFYSVYMSDYNEKVVLFNEHVNDDISKFQNQLNANQIAMRSAVGYFYASKSITSEGWKEFSSQLDLEKSMSGIHGLGVIYRVPFHQLKKFEKEIPAIGNVAFKVHKFDIQKTQTVDDSYIVTFIEPLANNIQALGLDQATEKKRKMAIDTATDTGELTVSENILLNQDSKKNQGFIVYMPLYLGKKTPSTIIERRLKSIGWISTAVLITDFFQKSFGEKYQEDISYAISELETGKRIFDTGGFDKLSSAFLIQEKLVIANRKYSVIAKPSKIFNMNINTHASWAAFIIILLTLLLAIFVAYIQSAETRANILVDERTKELELTGRIALLGGWEFDLTTKKISWSKISKEIFAVDPVYEPTIEKGLYFFKEGINRDTIKNALTECGKSGNPFDLELEFIDLSGNEKWLRIIGQAEIENNKPSRLFGTLQDISQRITTDQQLVIERTKAIQTAKLASLGEMSAGIAHEINNPLSIIAAQIDLLPMFAHDPEKFASKIESIKKATERIIKIISGLKKFSRSSEHTEHQPQSLANIVRESLVLTVGKSKKNDISVTCTINSEANIDCNEIEIEQVVINMINNAIDAIIDKEKKWVKLEVNEDAGQLVLHITDSGDGIPLEIQDKLFLPFFTTKTVGEGTGLGLSIVKGILEQHQASIRVLPDLPHTCFEIRFPITGA
jgi:C4-dicarboxylate-specific signal transduction histidine kinase/integral membrane sensor domain MASE1